MRLPAGRKLTFIFLLFFCVVFFTMHSCMTFRASQAEINSYFKEKGVAGRLEEYETGSREIHYAVAGDSTAPLVLFIHGSPGSLSAFIHFLTDTILLDKALLVTTDRPGFGFSNFGNAEPSLLRQATALKPILVRFQENRPIILVGHSLGAPLIARMAIEYPQLVDGLIIVAGSIDPELEPDETWFRAPLATPFLSWILPRAFRSSNEEIYQLEPQLREMLPRWKEIKCPVIVIQGGKDVLVPKENADFARKMLVNAPVELVLVDSMNHFVPWSHPQLIRDAVLKMLQTKMVMTH